MRACLSHLLLFAFCVPAAMAVRELASKSGRPTDDLVEDALAGYLPEAAQVREMLDGRYDDIKSGRVRPH
jgi:hypothetical protein